MPQPLGIAGAELVMTSEEFMAADAIGPRVVFIGGGYISFEFAHMAASAGAQVTIVHRSARALEGFDPDLADALVQGYRDAGIDVRLSATPVAVEASGDERAIVLEDGSRIECGISPRWRSTPGESAARRGGSSSTST